MMQVNKENHLRSCEGGLRVVTETRDLPDYREVFSGRLIGLLQWSQFERLWQWLADNPEGWYVRDFKTRQLPATPMTAAEFREFLKDAEAFLRRRHREDYCGFLYADDAETPLFIKVFDPRKMGSACGCSGKVVPRWTISRMPPASLDDEAEEARGSEGEMATGSSFFRRLFRTRGR